MFNPLDFRELPFEARIGEYEEATNVVYQFTGDTLKQVDRVTIVMTLPRVDGPPRGNYENGDPVGRITCGSEDGDFAIEVIDPAVVKVRNIDGRFRVTQTWKSTRGAEDPAFGFRIRERGSQPLDPQAALGDLRQSRKYGEAISLARDPGQAHQGDPRPREDGGGGPPARGDGAARLGGVPGARVPGDHLAPSGAARPGHRVHRPLP
jgi:hypothetical protein